MAFRMIIRLRLARLQAVPKGEEDESGQADMKKQKWLGWTLDSPREGCPKVDTNDQPVGYGRKVSNWLPDRPIDGLSG